MDEEINKRYSQVIVEDGEGDLMEAIFGEGWYSKWGSYKNDPNKIYF